MRTIIIALCMVLAAVSPGFQSKAQTGCKPNPQSKDYTGVSRLEDYTNNHVWSELFTLPSGVNAYASTDLPSRDLRSLATTAIRISFWWKTAATMPR